MKTVFKTVAASSAALVAMTSPLLASSRGNWWWWWDRPVSSVPEIDASTGALAVAAVLALLAFVYERRRRSA